MRATPCLRPRRRPARVDMLQQRIHRVMQAGNSINWRHQRATAAWWWRRTTSLAASGVRRRDAGIAGRCARQHARRRALSRRGLADLALRCRLIYSLFDAEGNLHRRPAATRASHASPPCRVLAASPTTPCSRRRPPLHRRPVWRGMAAPWSICGKSSRERAAFLAATGAGESPCRCTRCRTCAAGPSAGGRLPAAIGRHEVLCRRYQHLAEVGRIPVAGQPVFVMARPDGRWCGS